VPLLRAIDYHSRFRLVDSSGKADGASTVVEDDDAAHPLHDTALGRQVPELLCTAVLTADEWQSLHTVRYPGKPLPDQPPSLAAVIGMLATLGGHIAGLLTWGKNLCHAFVPPHPRRHVRTRENARLITLCLVVA
jgi:hypothetical protein